MATKTAAKKTTEKKSTSPKNTENKNQTTPVVNDGQNGTKAGYKTTEFYLTTLVVVASTLALLTGSIDQEAWAAAMSVSTAGYAISRGLTKKP